MCIEVILPSLFPFLVVSNLIIGLGFAETVGRIASPVMRRVFNLNGSCASAFIMGIVGGYPVGARAAITSYERGLCTKTECERMLSFCNNSGPAFILGVVGAGVFANSRAGMLLYLAHVLASLTVGVCFRFYKRREPVSRTRAVTYDTQKPSRVFVDSVRSGLAGIGNISAFVIFFAVAINLLFASGALGALAHGIAALLSPFGVDSGSVERLLVGAVEMTSGLTSLKGAAESMNARLSMAAFMLGWAGVSVHCQVLSFIGDSGLSLMPYLLRQAPARRALRRLHGRALLRFPDLGQHRRNRRRAGGSFDADEHRRLPRLRTHQLRGRRLNTFLLWIWDKIASRI